MLRDSTSFGSLNKSSLFKKSSFFFSPKYCYGWKKRSQGTPFTTTLVDDYRWFEEPVRASIGDSRVLCFWDFLESLQV